jgi:hypothetical protein
MSDWEKKYWEYRNKQLQGQLTASPTNNHVSQRPIPQQNGEIDITTALASRLSGMYGPMSHAPMSQNHSNTNTCTLREGFEYYQKINTGEFGGFIVLVRTVGVLQGLQDRQFELLNEVKAYVVDNLPTVDLSKIHEYDKTHGCELVAVRAPFLGTILVKKEAVEKTTASNSGNKTLLRG